MAELKDRLPPWATPQMFVSAANFVGIVFVGGMAWSSIQGDAAAAKQDIKDLKAEVRVLRANDTSIAVLRADISAVKESVQRIEAKVERGPIAR